MRVSSPLLIGALMVAMAACTQPTPPNADAPPAVDATTTDEPEGYTGGVPMPADGPTAAADRPLTPRSVKKNDTGTVIISEVDLGNTEAGKFRAPIRGVLVVPIEMADDTPLIVVNHLRGPNCPDGVLAYPCPDGEEGLRFDRGMTYFGEALAVAGYAVLIPDLSGIWVGADVTEPYDQNAMWTDAVSKLVDAIGTDAEGKTQVYGIPNLNKITRNKVGLMVHSRSGTIVDPAIKLFSADAVKGVLAYGPSYDTIEPETFTPAPADVPYLALTGEADLDVGASANLWLSEYLGKQRTTPAMAVAVPGLGHMFINRALVEAGIDDRTGCDLIDCADAAEHERVLNAVALDWFNTTLNGKAGALPTDAGTSLPTKVAGVDARWIAHSPGASVVHLTAADFKADESGSATVCRHADAMNPNQSDDACPDAEEGVVQAASEVNVLTAASATTDASRVKALAIHLSPSGSYADQTGSGTPVTVTLTLASGEPYTVTLDPNDPALIDRKTADDNGVYRIGTIRMPLPEQVTATTITKVTVQSDQHPVELRGVDLIN